MKFLGKILWRRLSVLILQFHFENMDYYFFVLTRMVLVKLLTTEESKWSLWSISALSIMSLLYSSSSFPYFPTRKAIMAWLSQITKPLSIRVGIVCWGLICWTNYYDIIIHIQGVSNFVMEVLDAFKWETTLKMSKTLRFVLLLQVLRA